MIESIKDNLSIIVADGYHPTLNLTNLEGIHINGVDTCLIEGLIFIGCPCDLRN